ncbi:MAG: hypothetical protein CL484_03215 [Acidobacteria bacterium]|nr:hypothetical protein [Acidobacteriota bacterium]
MLRRNFLLGALAAPALVRAGSLDFIPRKPKLYTLIDYASGPDITAYQRVHIDKLIRHSQAGAVELCRLTFKELGMAPLHYKATIPYPGGPTQ